MKDMISKIRFEFLMDHQFLGELALRLKVREGGGPTMSTDMKSLFYNREFVKSLIEGCSKESGVEGDIGYLMGVIAHEIAHCMFRHPMDKERHEGKNPDAWRIACEYTVNHVVIDMFGLKLPPNAFYDKKYSDGSWSTEAIYRDLMKDIDKLPKIRVYGAGDGAGKGVVVDDHSDWGKGGNETDAGAASVEQDWKVWVAQAAHNAKRQGTMPAGLERLVGDILEPKLNWRQLLAMFLTEKSKDDYSWRRPNKRQAWRGVYTPALHSETVRIGYAMDTSGSMSAEDLQAGLAEVRGICNSFPSHKLHLFACDADVHHCQEVGPADEVDIQGLLKGGGGTSFEPVFDKIRDDDIKLDALVYFTDAYGSFPDEPPYPTIWVVIGNGNVPFGRRVQYE